MENQKNEIPTWDEKSELIKQIEELDLAKTSIEEIMEMLKTIMKGLYLTTLVFPPGINLFRAIKYNAKPFFWDDLIYPPKEKAGINRASDIGEQRFYCSTVKKVPFYELDIQVGERLVISNWTNEIPLLLNNIGYSNTELEELAKNYRINFDINKINQKSNEDNIKVRNYLKEKFSKKIEISEYYKLSIAIAKKFYEAEIILSGGNRQWAGLLYHTIRLNETADNIVLKKEIIDLGIIKFQQIEFIEVVAIENDKYVYKILDFGDTVENGKIKWYNLTNTWTVTDESDDLYFAETEFGYALYTIDGEIVEPN